MAGGGLDVHHNKYIEEWATKRENIEKVFKFNRASLSRIAVFGVVIPFVIYKVTVAEFHKVDTLRDRPLKKFM
jgi:hypothetical protein